MLKAILRAIGMASGGVVRTRRKRATAAAPASRAATPADNLPKAARNGGIAELILSFDAAIRAAREQTESRS